MITNLFINGKIILVYGLEHFRFDQKGTNWDQILLLFIGIIYWYTHSNTKVNGVAFCDTIKENNH